MQTDVCMHICIYTHINTCKIFTYIHIYIIVYAAIQQDSERGMETKKLFACVRVCVCVWMSAFANRPTYTLRHAVYLSDRRICPNTLLASAG